MIEPFIYDGVVIILPDDLKKTIYMIPQLITNMPVRKLIFVGNEEVGNIVSNLSDDRLGYVNEESIIRFSDVEAVIKERLKEEKVPRRITGWYYQQFLKMGYSKICTDEYYLTWDGDTVPCGEFSMFKAGTNLPYLDVKHEYNEEYFVTMAKIFPGFHKVIGKSFISEHMLFKRSIITEMLDEIEKNDNFAGKTFYEKILNAVSKDKLKASSFSEFETYGTYVALKHSTEYMLRDWHSLRFGSSFFKPDQMTEEDFAWLGRDFEAISFEKDEEFLPEYSKFFNDPHYRDNLSARQVLEAIQDTGAIKANVIEKWD